MDFFRNPETKVSPFDFQAASADVTNRSQSLLLRRKNKQVQRHFGQHNLSYNFCELSLTPGIFPP